MGAQTVLRSTSQVKEQNLLRTESHSGGIQTRDDVTCLLISLKEF